MAGVSKTPSGRWRLSYTDRHGQRVQVVGTTDKAATLALALKLEREEREIRLGMRPPTTPQEIHGTRLVTDVIEEYLDWGQFQGGRHGRPWSPEHTRKRQRHLAWWVKQLGALTLARLGGILPKVEQALQALKRQGASGKTLKHRAEALQALCTWCVKREYLYVNPLQALGAIDASPQVIRRLLTPKEIRLLLATCPPHRRMLYATAMATGLRAGELRQLTPAHLDLTQGALHLDAAWTKNRKPGLQLLPWGLVLDLARHAQGREAITMYDAKRVQRPPTDPLLYVPHGPAREIRRDLQAAGVPQLPIGKVDFHALRAVYVSLVFEAGASVKEAQDLARLDTARLALETYARSRPEHLRPLVETVWQQIAGRETMQYTGADSVQRSLAVGENRVPYQTLSPCRRGDLNPGASAHDDDKATPFRPHLYVIPSGSTFYDTISRQSPDSLTQPSRADSVHALPADLQTLIAAWPGLAPAVRQQMLALARGKVVDEENPTTPHEENHA